MKYSSEDLLLNNGQFIEMAFVQAIIETFNNNHKKIEKFMKDAGDPPEYSLTVTCNGVELNFLALCKEWEKQVDRMVKEEAVKLIEGKLVDIKPDFDELNIIRKTYIEKVCEKLGVKIPDDMFD